MVSETVRVTITATLAVTVTVIIASPNQKLQNTPRRWKVLNGWYPGIYIGVLGFKLWVGASGQWASRAMPLNCNKVGYGFNIVSATAW